MYTKDPSKILPIISNYIQNDFDLPMSNLDLSSASFRYFNCLFGTMYYTGLSSFMIKSKGERFVFHTSRNRRIVSGFVNFLCGIFTLSVLGELIDITDDNAGPDVAMLFGKSAVYLVCWNQFVLVYLLWRKQSVIQKFVETCQKSGTSSKPTDGRKYSFMGGTICASLTLMGFLGGRDNPLTILYQSELNLETFMNTLVANFKRRLYLQDMDDSRLESLMSVAAGFYSLLSTYVHATMSFLCLMHLFASLAARQISIEFYNKLEQNRYKGPDDYILEQFHYASDLIELLNDFTGPAVLIISLTFLPLLSSGIARTLYDKPSGGHLTGTLMLVIVYLVIVLIAADASARFDKFKDWLLLYNPVENTARASKMNMLFMHVSNNPLGVKGLGLFTITYRFIGSFLSILVTYSIVAYQIEGASRKPNQ